MNMGSIHSKSFTFPFSLPAGGLTLTVVGAVQFKSEAGLGHLKHHFLAAGGVLLVAGLLLLIVKCACFRKPKYQVMFACIRN